MAHEKSAQFHIIECLLFVAGDPVAVSELARVLELSKTETYALLTEMETVYRADGRGIQLLVTEESAQLISNREFIDAVERLLQPQKTRSVSQSMLETLAVVAYRQPVTRADIEDVRGVRCEYAVSQLQKLGFIAAVGRRDTPGKPVLFGTTDKFLRHFGLHGVDELPDFAQFSDLAIREDAEEVPV